MSNNTDHDDMINEIAKLQIATNETMYGFVVGLYQELGRQMARGDATGLLLSALATNLGVVIGQIPEEHRTDYLNLVNAIIEKSCASTIETLSFQKYGQVGHA